MSLRFFPNDDDPDELPGTTERPLYPYDLKIIDLGLLAIGAPAKFSDRLEAIKRGELTE